jgi:nicotinate-nucleotide pyrophosphorylase (carboxylating)
VDEIIRLALDEDGRDITTEAVFSPTAMLRAVVTAKAAGVAAGVETARRVVTLVDPATVAEAFCGDGDRVRPKTAMMTVTGTARAVLKAERVALNFLQRASGIATMTAEYVERIRGTRARILDTRKTAPGMRELDKAAVRAGGGFNHRMGLFDMALIKDNHIDAAGSMAEAVRLVRASFPGVPVEVEARGLEDVKLLLDLGVDRIMLDNFTLEDTKKAVVLAAGRIPLEASGNISLEVVRAVAETGVDFISVGAVTHSARALDISMTIEGTR